MNIICAHSADGVVTYISEVRKSIIGELGKNEFNYPLNVYVSMNRTALAKQSYSRNLAFMPSRYYLHHCFTNFKRNVDFQIYLSDASSEFQGSDLATEVANEILKQINARYLHTNKLVNLDINVFDGLECGVMCLHDNVSNKNYIFLICQGRVLYVKHGSIIVLSTLSNKHSLMNKIMEDNTSCNYTTLPNQEVYNRIDDIAYKFDL